MESNRTRALIALAALVLGVVAFVALRGEDEAGTGSGDPPTTSVESSDAEEPPGGGKKKDGKDQRPPAEVPTIEIKGGEPEGGVAELEFSKGDEVRFVVDSDTAGEVHVHGYDLMEDVEAGEKVEFDFAADIDGIFEVELEETATPIAELTVTP